MALLANCPDLVPDSTWFPAHLYHPDDLWTKFDIDTTERTLVLPNPSPTDPQLTAFLTGAPNPTYTLPTPPHSPLTEHDLDDLVASIPEILESPSASPPSEISEILSDLEGMETAPSPQRLEGSWGGGEWWGSSLITPSIEATIKKDIMWGGGGGGGGNVNLNATVMNVVEIKKEPADADTTDSGYNGRVIYTDELTDESDADEMPDTPSCTDSDCDGDDPLWSPPQHPRPHHPSVADADGDKPAPSVNSEHNYCEPNHHHFIINHHITGTITPSDTEDEVDVVTCTEQNEPTTPTTTTTITPAATTIPKLPPPTTKTVDVKRQLQLAIQEAVRNRQNRGAAATTATTTPATDSLDDVTNTTRLLTVKIKTQGKPAAYTKRMRDYHSEVVKSTKHRRRNKGENDEGRRSVHNSLERQRRVDLRNAFEYLRQLVPDTKILEKAPKVQILKKAALHCKSLQLSEQRLIREKEKLKRQMEELQKRRALSS